MERRDIFLDDRDRLNLLQRLGEILPAARTECFAWALMPNHLHLILKTGAAPLGEAIHRIGTGYALYFNRRHERVGHLFQSRFKSRLVHDEADLMGLIRYVHLNPLRAGLVRSLGMLAAHRWCGHGALTGTRQPEPFHGVGSALSLFSDDVGEARQRLAEFTVEGLHGLDLRGPPDGLLDRPGDWERFLVLREQVCARYGVDPHELRGGSRTPQACQARSVLAHDAVRRLGLPAAAIAPELGAGAPSVRRAARRAAPRSAR